MAGTMANVLNCKPTHNAELRKIRTDYGLSRQVISELAGVSKSLVDSWLVAESSRNFRPMPWKSLRLIQLEMGLVEPCGVNLRQEAEARMAAIKGA